MWAGSKDRDYKVIKHYIPEFTTYFEPFLGGGAIYFRLLAERGIFPAFCSDINDDLITTYEIMRDDPKGLISGLPPTKDKTIFQTLLSSKPTDKLERAIRFLYLNRNRFFGMGGWMNADRYCRDTVVDRIEYFSPLMAKSAFSSAGCQYWPLDTPGAFVFCDPPYPDTNNNACYRIEDYEVMNLNLDYYDRVYNSQANFFWVTKYSEFFAAHATRPGVAVEKKEWTFRKPGKEVQSSFEIYASRDEGAIFVFGGG